MLDDFGTAWHRAKAIEGWLTEPQAWSLAAQASTTPPGHAIVEIGSHHGKSTTILASVKPEGARLLAVDPFDDPRWGGGKDSLAAFTGNLADAGLSTRVEIHRGLSREAADGWDGTRIWLVFVDGAHDTKSVLEDIDGWGSHVAPGGSMAFHDAYSSPGVTRAIFARMAGSRHFVYVGSQGSLAWFRRVQTTPAASAKSVARMTGRLPYFARNLAVKVAIRKGHPRAARLLGHTHVHYPF